MKLINTIVLVLLVQVFTACKETPTGNTNENFDFGWKFYAGDLKETEQPDFDDSTWRDVDLPHDWSIEGDFSKDNPSFSRGAWLPTGKVTYRKTFSVDKSQQNKRFEIYFDGAYRNSEVYINGHLLGKRPLGYIAFHYDMTDYINFDKENVITVKLDNSEQPGSRWYTGTGIYRHVNLITTNKLYIPVWGNYIVPKITSEQEASIAVETKVKNEFDEEKAYDIVVSVLDTNNVVVSKNKVSEIIKANSENTVNSSVSIQNPKLWDINNPYLYTVKTQLLVDGHEVYSENTKTGLRTLEFTNNEGFKLNGNVVKLKGVCLHHDGGPLGAAVYRRTIERQLEKLREMGCNAVRTAHNPFSEEFMNICDEMGFLVMNEMFDEWEIVKKPNTVQNGKKKRIPVKFYADIFKEWSDRDLTDFILRDRNHPSVIMWSIGNEIDQMRKPEGAPIGKRLSNIVHKLDYRPTTNGVNGYGWGAWPNADAAATSDVYGYNYIKGDGLDKERKINPAVKTVITEHESAQSFYPRSTYLYDDTKKAWWDKLDYEYNDAYEWVETRDIRGESGMDAWKWVKERDYISGMFIWTGWDYLGEVIPFGWPARSSSFAPIDLAGFPKDGYYFYQSQWTETPMVHIFPHWNLNGMEGKKVTIYSFTNGDEVELFQDGKSLGIKNNDVEGVEYQSWDVIYLTGELKAVAYKNGKAIAEKVVKTASAPAKIKVETRRTSIKSDGQDLIYVECSIQDKDGNEVPTANNLIHFDIEGPATIAGVANGDNMGLEPFKANKRTAFNGKCLAIIKSTKTAGDIKLKIMSEGLETSVVSFKSE